MTPTMKRSTVSRQPSAFAFVAMLLLALLVAGLSDPDVAGKVVHEPRDILETSVFLSHFGLSGYMLVLSGALAFVAIAMQRTGERAGFVSNARILAERATFFFVTIATSGIICQAIKHLLGRARPRFLSEFGAYHFVGPSFRSGIDSFPSGHTTTVFAAAVVLSQFKPSWKGGFFAVAVLIGLVRILAGAHYPSDVLAGAVLGSTVASILSRSFRHRGLLFDSGRAAITPALDRTERGTLARGTP